MESDPKHLDTSALTCIDCGVYVEEVIGGIAICGGCFAARGSCCQEFGTAGVTEETPDEQPGSDAEREPCRSPRLVLDEPIIQHDETARRFFTATGALLEYRMPRCGEFEITHTFVPESLRGKGLAADLMEAAIRYAQAKELTIRASCGYARIYLKRTPLPLEIDRCGRDTRHKT